MTQPTGIPDNWCYLGTDRAKAFDGTWKVIIELDEDDVREAGWPTGFYGVDMAQEEAEARLRSAGKLGAH